MRSTVAATLLLSLSQQVLSSPRKGGQAVLAPPSSDNEAVLPPFPDAHGEHVVDEAILAALDAHSSPVDALLSLQPELAAQLAEPRLIHVFEEPKAEWRTEGDKLHLRREGKKFQDITDYQELYTDSVETQSGKPSTLALARVPAPPGSQRPDADLCTPQTFPSSPTRISSTLCSQKSRPNACTTS